MIAKLGRVVAYHKGLPPIKSHDPLTMWSFEITWQIKNMSPLEGAYRQQTWQDYSWLWWPAAHKVAWCVDAVLQYHLTNWNRYIVNNTVPMTNTFGKMVTYNEELILIKSHNALITLPWKIRWQTKIITSPLLRCVWQTNLTGW